ncbi:acyl-CoA dehydrogenase family protein [Pontixanthobacter aquaemixtae]|uniref:Acyl-CoA dehydrogenase n=1 Tax=Pontixanthobacter aquaemixtae TaxID=1958940 RepID=A0A844ZS13_9SPHN|nr:acyl-CoA dehydrogenase family protein [Pontixanthobacter aquaemixtae]MXO89890.1 acyl-CoA dehydrogenase [Pontixanthobacter aquaemixtae]
MASQKDIDRTSDPETFRQEVRQFIAENFPDELKSKGNALAAVEGPATETAAQKSWREAMGSRGWGTPTWPAEYGGGGLSRKHAAILNEELAKAKAHNPIGGMGVMMFGPTLLEYGSEEQKREHIPPICRGEIRWCQGYSEPNAGSDLANLQTMAEDKGDHYLVNGQKTWTSGGQWADKCFCLVRTDRSDKHKGISFLLIDMDSPGVEVRPIQMISGMSPFCETFFDDVKVPKENLVGEEGQGWTIGKRLLQHERTNLSGGGSMARMMGASLADIAKRYVETDSDGRIADAVLRDRIADFEIRWNAFLLTARRAAQESKAQGGVSEISSVLKKVGTKLGQERAELTIEIMGLQGLGWEGEGFTQAELAGVRGWLFGKATTIYGGSTEIQNNIIAKRVLGMLDHQ